MAPEVHTEEEVVRPVKNALEQLQYDPTRWQLHELYEWVQKEQTDGRRVLATNVHNKFPEFRNKDRDGKLERAINEMVAILREGSVARSELRAELDQQKGTERYTPKIPVELAQLKEITKKKAALKKLIGREVNEDLVMPGEKQPALKTSQEIAVLYEELYELEKLDGYKIAIGYYYLAAAAYELDGDHDVGDAKTMSDKAAEFVTPGDKSNPRIVMMAENVATAALAWGNQRAKTRWAIEYVTRWIPYVSGGVTDWRMSRAIPIYEYGIEMGGAWAVDQEVIKKLEKAKDNVDAKLNQ